MRTLLHTPLFITSCPPRAADKHQQRQCPTSPSRNRPAGRASRRAGHEKKGSCLSHCPTLNLKRSRSHPLRSADAPEADGLLDPGSRGTRPQTKIPSCGMFPTRPAPAPADVRPCRSAVDQSAARAPGTRRPVPVEGRSPASDTPSARLSADSRRQCWRRARSRGACRRTPTLGSRLLSER